MRWCLALSVLVVCGCSNGDELIPTGEHESPCGAGVGECSIGFVCLQIDDFGTCTARCSTGSDRCHANYVCDASLGACVPSGAGTCRQLHGRCGPSFPRCCSGMACVDFGEWGSRCAEVGCARDRDCDSYTGFCCVSVGADTVCAPPTHCPD